MNEYEKAIESLEKIDHHFAHMLAVCWVGDESTYRELRVCVSDVVSAIQKQHLESVAVSESGGMKMPDRVKVEFIESFIKIGDGDYRWNDNHGELIRCKDCMHWLPMDRFHQDYHPGRGECELHCWVRDSDWFCADGVRRDRDARQG